jgi:hypothetical protein
MIDCNNCPHLSITEEQQDYLRMAFKKTAMYPHILDTARELQEEASTAILECLNYIERHTEKSLRHYGTDLMYHYNLLEAIDDYINGDEYVCEHSRTLKYDIKDAMEVRDYE